jgi:hypothetical protein
MRRLLVVGSVLALAGLVAGPAAGARTVPAKVKFEAVSSFTRGKHQTAIVTGSINSKVKACRTKTRRITLYDADTGRKLGAAPAGGGYWSVETAAIQVGDRLFAKLVAAKATEDGKNVSCAAVKSKVYKVKKVTEGAEG